LLVVQLVSEQAHMSMADTMRTLQDPPSELQPSTLARPTPAMLSTPALTLLLPSNSRDTTTDVTLPSSEAQAQLAHMSSTSITAAALVATLEVLPSLLGLQPPPLSPILTTTHCLHSKDKSVTISVVMLLWLVELA